MEPGSSLWLHISTPQGRDIEKTGFCSIPKVGDLIGLGVTWASGPSNFPSDFHMQPRLRTLQPIKGSLMLSLLLQRIIIRSGETFLILSFQTTEQLVQGDCGSHFSRNLDWSRRFLAVRGFSYGSAFWRWRHGLGDFQNMLQVFEFIKTDIMPPFDRFLHHLNKEYKKN